MPQCSESPPISTGIHSSRYWTHGNTSSPRETGKSSPTSLPPSSCRTLTSWRRRDAPTMQPGTQYSPHLTPATTPERDMSSRSSRKSTRLRSGAASSARWRTLPTNSQSRNSRTRRRRRRLSCSTSRLARWLSPQSPWETWRGTAESGRLRNTWSPQENSKDTWR